ncbi:MAG: 4Fe-4S binding protein [Acidimicrobiales bacterium]
MAGLETTGVTRVFDDDGRFAPQFDPADLRAFEADTVILAIGQAIDLDALGPDGPEASPRRTIAIDDTTGATSVPGIWSGSDAARAPTLIAAIAAARRPQPTSTPLRPGGAPRRRPRHDGEAAPVPPSRRDYDRHDRVAVPTAGHRPAGWSLAEVGAGSPPSRPAARRDRCLALFANILLDVNRCVLCALCSGRVPVDVISLVPSEEVDPDQPGGTALLIDESRCIRCGLCIERCPPDALSMGVWTGVGVPT